MEEEKLQEEVAPLEEIPENEVAEILPEAEGAPAAEAVEGEFVEAPAVEVELPAEVVEGEIASE